MGRQKRKRTKCRNRLDDLPQGQNLVTYRLKKIKNKLLVFDYQGPTVDHTLNDATGAYALLGILYLAVNKYNLNFKTYA